MDVVTTIALVRAPHQIPLVDIQCETSDFRVGIQRQDNLRYATRKQAFVDGRDTPIILTSPIQGSVDEDK